MNEYRTDTHLGAYLFRENHFKPTGLTGFAVMAILYGYADTSGKETTGTDRVLTVNGCLSTREKWQQFDNDWQDYLKAEYFKPDSETGRYVFHTSDFWSQKCKLMPENLSKFSMDRIYLNLIGLICKHTVYRFGYGILLDDYRRFEQDYPGARVFLKQPGTYASGLCFNWNFFWATDNGFHPLINYMFDRGDEFWGELFEDYRETRRKITDPDELILGDLSDGNKAEHSPLQAADIVAWEARKYFLGLSESHLSDASPPKRPRMEMNRLGRDGNAGCTLYRYRELLEEIIINVQTVLEKNDRLDTVIGEGKLFASVDDYTRALLAVAKDQEDHKKKTLRDAQFAKIAARREAEMTKKQANGIEMKNDGNDAARFQSLLKTVVNVPKDEVKKEEERRQKAKKKKP